MTQAVQDDSLTNQEEIDEELQRQIDQEEELEKQYGDDEEESRRPKNMGPGFSKQKQVMEESGNYQASKKKKVKIIDKRKK